MDTFLSSLPELSERDLLRRLRNAVREANNEMPESVAWASWIELDRRGVGNATGTFISTLKHLHNRRAMGVAELSIDDPHLDEHRLTDDRLLSELWRAYKRCLRDHRTGPAWHLLCEIEERLSA